MRHIFGTREKSEYHHQGFPDIRFSVFWSEYSLVLGTCFLIKQLTKIDTLDGEIDDGWILLQREDVLHDALHEENEIGREALEAEATHGGVTVRLVLLLCDAVELGQEGGERHLRDDALLELVQI